MTRTDLANLLNRLDRKPYPAYKDLRGRYDFGAYMLAIDHVQGDPFAAPSRLSIAIDHDHSELPPDLFRNRSRRIGTENFLAVAFDRACRAERGRLGSGKSGLVAIDAPGQELLERTCVTIAESQTKVRFVAGLPADGRRINGRAAALLLTERIPEIVEQALLYQNQDTELIRSYADTNEDADYLRDELARRQLIAFVADGAILPRASGVEQRPLPQAIPFKSTDSLRLPVTLPNAGEVSGMGIPEGVTLIVGGGYHGKSTLLNAIERGVYNHRPGDGRERVVTRRDATKVRAEDGRSVASVDLSPFINNLPGGKDTLCFTTENASGSTSQAASIIETLETGSRILLIDEDISATNFLIRDSRMQQLIAPEKEPITPFVHRVRTLYDQHGVSTLLVLGGSSDYFEPAHRVIAFDNYLPVDLTREAKALCNGNNPVAFVSMQPIRGVDRDQPRRFANPESVSPYKDAAPYRGSKPRGQSGSRPARKRVMARDTRSLAFGTEEIDLSLLSQVVDPSQTRAIGAALAYATDHELFEEFPLIAALAKVVELVEEKGLSSLNSNDLAAFRLQDFAAALNRLRSLRCEVR